MPPPWPCNRTAELWSAAYSASGNWDLLRFLPDGAVDSNFGTGGMAAVPSSPANLALGAVTSVAIQPNNEILVSGDFSITGTEYQLGVVRVGVDGNLDDNFGAGGNGFAYSGVDSSTAAGLAVQPDGSIVAAGFSGTLSAPGAARMFPCSSASPPGTSRALPSA